MKTNNFPVTIEDNYELLALMVQDAKKVEEIYKPGPYWSKKTKSAVSDIKKFGLSNFRGMENSAATSYGDNAIIDLRNMSKFRITSLLFKIFHYFYPDNSTRLFDQQVNLTFSYFKTIQKHKMLYLKNHDRVRFLLSKYNITFDTTRGGCLSYGKFGGVNISFHYLQMLDTLDHVDRKVNIMNKKTFFEIGGGFGANTHLMIELFKIKKIIFLDVSPNLYVGTQYLKSYYGENVIDYTKNKNLEDIKFSNTDELEIYCITPSQIKNIKSEIDFFHNAHSFVEMPENVIQNYAEQVEKILSKDNSSISLVSYANYDLNTTIDPVNLPKFFTKPALEEIIPILTPSSSNYHYIIQ